MESLVIVEKNIYNENEIKYEEKSNFLKLLMGGITIRYEKIMIYADRNVCKDRRY
jgi:hypothetical protein